MRKRGGGGPLDCTEDVSRAMTANGRQRMWTIAGPSQFRDLFVRNLTEWTFAALLTACEPLFKCEGGDRAKEKSESARGCERNAE